MWRRVFHLIAKVGAESPAPGRFGSIRLWTKTGAGSSRNPYMLKCAVFSGDGIALLLTPGTGSMQARLEVQTARYQRTVAEVTKLPSRSLSISLLPCDTGLCDCGDHASGDTLRRSKAPDLPLIPSMLSFGRAGCSISRRYSVPDAIP